MFNQLTNNAEALRLFFTEDIYLVQNGEQATFVAPHEEVSYLMSQEIIAPKIKDLPNETTPSFKAMVEEPKPTFKKEWNFKFLGKLEKGILILVNDKNNKVSSAQGNTLLRNLVDAIGLKNGDFAVVNYANYLGASYEDLYVFFKSNLVLSFGVDFKELALANQPLHQLFKIDDTKLIFTSNLDDLDGDKESKKVLWIALQQLK
jgi:hypothetical protein